MALFEYQRGQTAQTGHPREYGKIDETFSPLALQLVGDWIVQSIQMSRTDNECPDF